MTSVHHLEPLWRPLRRIIVIRSRRIIRRIARIRIRRIIRTRNIENKKKNKKKKNTNKKRRILVFVTVLHHLEPFWRPLRSIIIAGSKII